MNLLQRSQRLAEVARRLLFTAQQFGEWVRPERMIAPEP